MVQFIHPWRRYTLITIILIICGFFTLSASADQSVTDQEKIVLHVVLPAIDDQQISGESALVAINAGIDEMNELMTSVKSDISVQAEVKFISSTPESAQKAIEQLHEDGVTMVIGFFSSAQIKAIRDRIETYDMLVLTSGPTAPSLAIDDNILRFTPDDTIQAEALVALLEKKGISTIVPLVRDDIWGRELVAAVHEKMTENMTIDSGITYVPDEDSFTDILLSLDNKIGQILEQEKTDNVGLLAVTFGEIVSIMETASDPSYHNLSKVRWFGVDGNIPNSNLIKSNRSARFAEEREFIGTTYNPVLTNSKIYEKMTQELGYEPDGYDCAFYDMAKIALNAHLLNGENSAFALRKAVTGISASYSGFIMEPLLNEYGDNHQGQYAYWTVITDETGISRWDLQGTYTKWDAETNLAARLNEK